MKGDNQFPADIHSIVYDKLYDGEKLVNVVTSLKGYSVRAPLQRLHLQLECCLDARTTRWPRIAGWLNLSTHMEIMFGVFVFLLERGEEGVQGQDGEAVLHSQHNQI